MRFSENGIKNISVSLNKVISEVKDVNKNSKGFGYSYASLDEVLKTIRPILSKNGLAIIQSQEIDREAGFVVVKTLLTHTSGEWLETTAEAPIVELKGMNSYQSIGAATTYLRRYAISSLFAISSEEDTDATSPQQNAPQQNQQKPQKNQNQNSQTQQTQTDWKQLGISFQKNENGDYVAIEDKKGAIFQNKQLLKQAGFKWNAELKAWVRPA